MGPVTLFDMSRSRRSLSLALLVFCIFAWLTYNKDSSVLLRPTKWSASKAHGGNQVLDLSHLEKHHLSDTFSYSRRTIRTKAFEGKRETLTTINATLFPTLEPLHAANLTRVSVAALADLTLQVPVSPEADTSFTSFGIATTAQRLPDAFPNLQHWLSNTKSSLHVVLSDYSDEELSSLQSQLSNEYFINATLTPTALPFPKAYFSLIKELYDSRTPKTRWIVLIDDDTFIPSLPTLISHLNRNYDHTQELLVSASSDNIEQIRTFGIQPFGGGGIFMSVPLAASLVKPRVWEACMSIDGSQGDQMVNHCLQAHSPARPIFDQGLNQMDFQGDFWTPAGYFESGRKMLTIHHWRSWFHVDMPAVAAVSKACGYEGTLMRWRFSDDVVLSNGYSIAEYPKGISDEDLEAVEQTWGDPGERDRYIFRIGPLRAKLGTSRKKGFGMVETAILEEGVRQTYMDVSPEKDGKKTGQDRIVELVWLYK